MASEVELFIEQIPQASWEVFAQRNAISGGGRQWEAARGDIQIEFDADIERASRVVWRTYWQSSDLSDFANYVRRFQQSFETAIRYATPEVQRLL